MTTATAGSTAIIPSNGKSQPSALSQMAARFAVSETNLASTIKKMCIKGSATDDEFRAFIIVANQYGLNPLTREIHAFASNGTIVPIVGIDGWARIVNESKRFNGCTFTEVKDGDDLGITCTMFVKDRDHPVEVTEWLSECHRPTGPWKMKRRMLRHKAFMQAARIAFSIGGIYDEDEARDIIEQPAEDDQPTPAERRGAEVMSRLSGQGGEPPAQPEVFEGEEKTKQPDPPKEEAKSSNEAEPSKSESQIIADGIIKQIESCNSITELDMISNSIAKEKKRLIMLSDLARLRIAVKAKQKALSVPPKAAESTAGPSDEEMKQIARGELKDALMQSWEACANLLFDAAKFGQPGLDRETFNKSLNLSVVGVGKKGGEDKIGAETRLSWYDRMRAGEFPFAGYTVKK
jgi:hypothetical protein